MNTEALKRYVDELKMLENIRVEAEEHIGRERFHGSVSVNFEFTNRETAIDLASVLTTATYDFFTPRKLALKKLIREEVQKLDERICTCKAS